MLPISPTSVMIQFFLFRCVQVFTFGGGGAFLDPQLDGLGLFFLAARVRSERHDVLLGLALPVAEELLGVGLLQHVAPWGRPVARALTPLNRGRGLGAGRRRLGCCLGLLLLLL